VKADELESLTLNNSLRAIVDSAASSLELQSPDIAVRTQAINTLFDQPENASRAAVEAARKAEADAGLRARST
jgi:urea transport system permease protein